VRFGGIRGKSSKEGKGIVLERSSLLPLSREFRHLGIASDREAEAIRLRIKGWKKKGGKRSGHDGGGGRKDHPRQ